MRTADDPVPGSLPAERRRGQFSVGDLLILTVGVAVGLAGGSWMPTDVFAAVLGLCTLLGLLVVSWRPPRSHFSKVIWAMLVLAYVVAVFAAVFRPLCIPRHKWGRHSCLPRQAGKHAPLHVTLDGLATIDLRAID